MKKMSSKERLVRAIKHEEYDCAPCSPRMFNWMSGTYGSDDWVAQVRAKKEFGHDPIIEADWFEFVPNFFHRVPMLGADILPDVSIQIKTENGTDSAEMTRIIRTPAGELKEVRIIGFPGPVHGDSPDPFYKEYLIKEPADLAKIRYIMPPVRQNYYTLLPTIIEMVGEEGLVEVLPFEGPGGYLLSDLIGPENAFFMALDNEPFFMDCLRLFNEYRQVFMKQALECGAAMIFDSWWAFSLGSGWGLNHWQKFALPFIKANIDLVHGYNAFYHYYDDGKMAETLPYVVEAGADVIETLSPPPLGDVSLKTAKETYGNKTCLKGNVDQINFIWRGTPEEVRAAVFEALKAAAGTSGFILSTSDSMRPESPRRNVEAFFDAWREYYR